MSSTTPYRLSVLLLSTMLATLAFSSPATVAAQGVPKTPIVAVLDLDLVFLQSSYGQALQNEISALQESTRKELEGKARELKELEDSLDPTDTSAVIAARRKREDLEIEARRLQEAAQRKAATAETTQREQFTEKMQAVLADLQKERGYDLILNKSAGAVIFAGESIDITAELLSRLEK